MIIKGVVIHGRSLGRTLGFPTANIALNPETSIESGVYISRAIVDGVAYKAISNIGVKPTVGGDVKGLECHILDFKGDLYNQIIEIKLISKLRDEIHFESIDTLRAQVELDIEKVKNLK